MVIGMKAVLRGVNKKTGVGKFDTSPNPAKSGGYWAESQYFQKSQKQVSENLTIWGYFSGVLKSWRAFLAGKKFVEIFETPVLVRDSVILRAF